MTSLKYCTLLLIVLGGIIGTEQAGAGGLLIGSLAGWCVAFFAFMFLGGD